MSANRHGQICVAPSPCKRADLEIRHSAKMTQHQKPYEADENWVEVFYDMMEKDEWEKLHLAFEKGFHWENALFRYSVGLD